MLNPLGGCQKCVDLEQAHDEKMEHYISLVELQTRLFRKGYVRAGKDLDVQIRRARDAREAALDELLNHSSACHPVPSAANAIGASK
ncbi:MAG TPA: hypothetical protein VKU01_11715 [Bryobacteraceae bacterium]|nr:hypothetical protein [Bryobacteraceae bacterium]